MSMQRTEVIHRLLFQGSKCDPIFSIPVLLSLDPKLGDAECSRLSTRRAGVTSVTPVVSIHCSSDRESEEEDILKPSEFKRKGFDMGQLRAVTDDSNALLQMKSNKHNIVKVSYQNRRVLMHLSLLFSLLGTVLLLLASLTNSWIYTAERLRYWKENETNPNVPDYLEPSYFRNASFGPWKFCLTDPDTSHHCEYIQHFKYSESADVTEAIEIALRKTIILLLATVILCLFGTLSCCLSTLCHHQKYRIIFLAGAFQVVAGIANLLFLVVYVSCITQEVGNKLYPESALDKPLFYYDYGYSFLLSIVSFLCTEFSALFSLSVYMAKHDEDMWNKTQIYNLFAPNPGAFHKSNIFARKRGSRFLENYDGTGARISAENTTFNLCGDDRADSSGGLIDLSLSSRDQTSSTLVTQSTFPRSRESQYSQDKLSGLARCDSRISKSTEARSVEPLPEKPAPILLQDDNEGEGISLSRNSSECVEDSPAEHNVPIRTSRRESFSEAVYDNVMKI